MNNKEKISSILINDIKKHFGKKLRKRPVSKKYETTIAYELGQNKEARKRFVFFPFFDN